MELAPSTDIWNSLLLSLAAVMERIQRTSAVSETTLERVEGYGVAFAEPGFFLKIMACKLLSKVSTLVASASLLRRILRRPLIFQPHFPKILPPMDCRLCNYELFQALKQL